MTYTDVPLWDDTPQPDVHVHACTGPTCRWCQHLAGTDAADAGAAASLTTDHGRAWCAAADGWLREQQRGGLFTADDLTDAVGVPPSPGTVGAWTRRTAADGRIRPAGMYAPARRRSSHGRPVGVWVVA